MKSSTKTTGLRYWMLRVLDECDRVEADFKADPVHDLRVALRRCRSLADGMAAMDPDPGWKAMKKSGKRLFQRLGALRDVQIMMEWIEKLHPPVERPPMPAAGEQGGTPDENEPSPEQLAQNSGNHLQRDPAAHALLEILGNRELQEKDEARAALEEFDRKQWRLWSKSLPLRAARIRSGSAVIKHL